MSGIDFRGCRNAVQLDLIGEGRCLRGLLDVIWMAGLWKLVGVRGLIWRYARIKSLPLLFYVGR